MAGVTQLTTNKQILKIRLPGKIFSQVHPLKQFSHDLMSVDQLIKLRQDGSGKQEPGIQR
jgi:hypothetical protein